MKNQNTFLYLLQEIKYASNFKKYFVKLNQDKLFFKSRQTLKKINLSNFLLRSIFSFSKTFVFIGFEIVLWLTDLQRYLRFLI